MTLDSRPIMLVCAFLACDRLDTIPQTVSAPSPPPPAEFCVCVLAKRGSFRHLQRMRLAYSLAFCPAESDLRHQLDAAARLRPPRWRWTGREWPRLLPCSLASTDDSASPAAPSWHSVEPNLTRDARPMPTACFCRFLPLVFVLLNATPQYVSCRSVFILVSSLILQMGDGLLTGSAKLSLTRDTSSIPHDCRFWFVTLVRCHGHGLSTSLSTHEAAREWLGLTAGHNRSASSAHSRISRTFVPSLALPREV